MSDSELPGPGPESAPVSLDPVDASLDTPNCEACLNRMEPQVTPTGAAYWSCPECGQTRIA
ncbi:hypothetical protein [uncultured Amnibacterium sp.]|uniref:hypothetical protein n=1 Tax=uncultured Amnibacterium sp. TaxID=1631851 RepID=UPI0035CB0F36